MARTKRSTVADADDAHRREAARLALGEKAAFDRCQQRFGNRVPAARAADQDGVPVLNELCRFVCSDLFHQCFPGTLVIVR